MGVKIKMNKLVALQLPSLFSRSNPVIFINDEIHGLITPCYRTVARIDTHPIWNYLRTIRWIQTMALLKVIIIDSNPEDQPILHKNDNLLQ